MAGAEVIVAGAEVIVAGAGIGGLSAARSLRERGYEAIWIDRIYPAIGHIYLPCSAVQSRYGPKEDRR
jgi:succinate dehydrogenase/fumarate reductase flavoprotein subunit